MPSRKQADPVLDALRELRAALEANRAAADEICRRMDRFEDARSQGASYTDIVTNSPRPLIVELVTAKLDRLATAGSKLRRAEAAALHAEGLTMDRIADLFGVTRQRVSALLKAAEQHLG
jgi:hypothetical protein